MFFLIRRIFRRRRLSLAEHNGNSPPSSPLLRGLNSPLPAGIARSMSQRSGARADPFWSRGHGSNMGSSASSLNAINIGVANGKYESDRFSGMGSKEFGDGYSDEGRDIGPVPVSPLPPMPESRAGANVGGVNGMGKSGGGFSLFPPPVKNEPKNDFPDKF